MNKSITLEQQTNANVVVSPKQATRMFSPTHSTFSPTQPANMDYRRISEDPNKFTTRTFNNNEFNVTTASFLGRNSNNSVVNNVDKKLQGAQVYRSKRDLINRNSSVDDNQFIKKAQEMVHESFGENDLSRSFISAKKDVRQSCAPNAKDGDSLLDFNSTSNNVGDNKYMNQTRMRALASLNEAENFFSQHSALDAVSEVDS